MPEWQSAIVFVDEAANEWQSRQRLALAIDCADSDRTGRRRVVFDEAECQMALDHHVSSGESKNLRLIDAQAAATAEIIADLISDLEGHLQVKLMDRDIASFLIQGDLFTRIQLPEASRQLPGSWNTSQIFVSLHISCST
jgi:nanoRNase/pAp phosphatase (c-di-AMP/oligoRNAs hydrolase)